MVFTLISFINFVKNKFGEKRGTEIFNNMPVVFAMDMKVCEWYISLHYKQEYEAWQKHIKQVNKKLDKHSKTLLHTDDPDIDL